MAEAASRSTGAAKAPASGGAAAAAAPAPGYCHFFLAQKNRYCRFQAPQGQTLCSHHAATAAAAAGGERRRVPCPVDPNHSVYEDRLDKHVAVCSSRPPPRPAFAQARANRPDEALYAAWAADGGGGPTPTLQETPADTIHAIIAKIQAAAARLLPPEVGAGGVVDGWGLTLQPIALRSSPSPPTVKTIALEVRDHPVVRADIVKFISNGQGKMGKPRHLEQQASLVGHLKDLGLLAPGHSFVEFGAGRARFLHVVCRALESEIAEAERQPSCRFLAIDRARCSRKADGHIRDSSLCEGFERARIDIEELKLAQVPLLQDAAAAEGPPRPVVAIGKHVCGAATDLTLQCLINFTADVSTAREDVGDADQSGSQSKRARLDEDARAPPAVDGLVIALCCHQLCRPELYCNPQFVREELGLSVDEFRLATAMSTWAVCGRRAGMRGDPAGDSAPAEEDAGNEDNEDNAHAVSAQTAEQLRSTGERLQLGHEEREQIGRTIKRLLDLGRLQAVQQRMGLRARLVYYADPASTLENCALLACRQSARSGGGAPS